MENWFCCKEWKIELLQFRFFTFIGNIHLLFLFILFLELNQLRRHISVQYFFNGMIYYEKKQANCFFYRLVISDDAVNSLSTYSCSNRRNPFFSYTCIHIRKSSKKNAKAVCRTVVLRNFCYSWKRKRNIFGKAYTCHSTVIRMPSICLIIQIRLIHILC